MEHNLPRIISARKMTYNGLILCRIQADLFANYYDFSPCSPYIFIRRFSYSFLAKSFDDTTILLDASSNQTFIDEIDRQFGKTTFGASKQIDKDAMYWVGYVYRYISYIYKISSDELFIKVKPNILLSRFRLYHSMDIEYAIERIIEEEGIDLTTHKEISTKYYRV